MSVNFKRWWREDPLAQRLLQQEGHFLSHQLNVPYTSTLVQIGSTGWEETFLDSGYRPRFFLIEEQPEGGRIISHLASLPIASSSVDVVILPHTLERIEERHQLLREVERILKPEGTLLIAGFHPLNFYRLCRFRFAPWLVQTLAARRLLDWLELLNFAARIEAEFTLRKTHRAGVVARILAIGYGIRAVKRTYAAIPFKLDNPALDFPFAEGIPTISREKL